MLVVGVGAYLSRRKEASDARPPPRIHANLTLAIVLLASISLALPASAQVSAQDLSYPICNLGCVTTYHNDNTRQGVNSGETVLADSTLVSNHFGFKATAVVDGEVYAQPLYMSGLTGFSTSNSVVFVATEAGTLYALDGISLAMVKSQSILPSGDVPVPQHDLPKDSPKVGGMYPDCSNITYQVGITSTPVIDAFPPYLSSSRPLQQPVLFAVTKSKTTATSTYHFTLYAWDFLYGTLNTSLDIGTALPSGASFSALVQNQRAGLAMSHDALGNPIVYVSWGSHCDSHILDSAGTTLRYFDGYVAAFKLDYSTNVLSLVDYWASEPTPAVANNDGGIWMAGAAPAIDDPTGDVYLATGNGNFNPANAGGGQWGESLVRLAQNLTTKTLTAVGSYTPNAWSILNNGGALNVPAPNAGSGPSTLNNDQDLGGGGVVLMHPLGQTGYTPSFELITAGKEGVGYLVDPTTLTAGTASTADSADACGTKAKQCLPIVYLPAPVAGTVPDGSGARGVPAFWQGSASSPQNLLFAAGSGDSALRYWQMSTLSPLSAVFDVTSANGFATGQPPLHGGMHRYPYPGSIPSISWNGSDVTTASVWVVDNSGFGNGSPAILSAYTAAPTFLSGRLNRAPTFQDSVNGPVAVKWAVPTIINGSVYVAGQDPTHICVPGTDATCKGRIARWGE